MFDKNPKMKKWFDMMMKIPEIEEVHSLSLPILEAMLEMIESKINPKL